jgi:hypothetical protein
MYDIRPLHKNNASVFVAERHYSAVMPRLTKHYLGFHLDDKLVGVLTLGWGTNPMGTIKKMFPDLTTSDYFEIGKMCMDDSMPRNSESQMLSQTVKWMRENTDAKYLYTWADGIVGKPGYVYQSANFLYGGFIWSDVYVSETGEKVHFRTIQRKMKKEMGRHDTKYGPRPNDAKMGDMGFSRVWGKQFRYIYPLTKTDRKYMNKHSTCCWTNQYPKDDDLQWKIKRPGETEYEWCDDMPFIHSNDIKHNKSNIARYKADITIDSFF